MSLRPRPEVENLKVCPHGGPDYAELRAAGLAPEDVLDFSVSANPFMPPPGVKEILNTVAIDRYPDSDATEFRQCISEKLGVAQGNILAANGAVELIRLIALTYFGHGDSVLILEPTFGEYEVACQLIGSKVFRQRGRAEENFVPKTEEIIDLIRQYKHKGIFICNPNNPTGQYFSRQDIETISDACGDGLLILDEAYIAFVDGNWSSVDLISRGNVVIVRSMTKDYALAGLRFGYAIAGQEIISDLRRVCPPWNTNIVAQKAGVVALGDINYLDRCKKKILEAKKFLVDELEQVGFPSLPSKANFFLVKVGDGETFRSTLLKHRILVRDCASFGLPEYIRIAPRAMPECRTFIATIRELKRKGELSPGN